MLRFLTQSIQVKLSAAFTAVTLVAAMVAGGVAFYDTYQETHKLQDGLLRQTAAHINPTVQPRQLKDSDNDARIFVQTPVTPRDKHYLDLPDGTGNGFYTLEHDGDPYRVYVDNTPQGRVVVLQENEYREEMAVRAAWSSALPLLVLVPVMLLLTVWIIRRTMQPVRSLSESVEARQDNDLAQLDTQHIPSEISGFVAAINRLLARTDAAMRQQQRFIADAAHEMRTPMTALSVQADRLAEQDLPADAREKLYKLQQGIHRNKRLLEQMLSLARVQAPEAFCQQTEISMQALFRRVLEELLPLAEQKNQDIGMVSEQDVRFVADETAVYTLVKTLADNAVRYTPPGSRIDLAADETAGYIRIRVEDNGTGISAAERARVCEPFYRILGTEQEGTGLGLSIASGIAARYGGRLELADSPNFERGLLVSVWLAKPLPKGKQ